jgi:hypothetical protein
VLIGTEVGAISDKNPVSGRESIGTKEGEIRRGVFQEIFSTFVRSYTLFIVFDEEVTGFGLDFLNTPCYIHSGASYFKNKFGR